MAYPENSCGANQNITYTERLLICHSQYGNNQKHESRDITTNISYSGVIYINTIWGWNNSINLMIAIGTSRWDNTALTYSIRVVDTQFINRDLVSLVWEFVRLIWVDDCSLMTLDTPTILRTKIPVLSLQGRTDRRDIVL